MQLGTITNLNYMQQGEVERNRSNIKSCFFRVRQSIQKPCTSEQFHNAETAEEGSPSRKDMWWFVSGVLAHVS